MLRLLILLASVAAALLYRYISQARRKDYPPGPSQWPLIGNLDLLFTEGKTMPELLQSLAKQYGEIFTLQLGTQTMIVLSSPRAIHEVLEKPGKMKKITSDRGDHYLAHTVLSGDQRMLLMRNGAQLANQRRHLHPQINKKAAEQYRPYFNLETKALLSELLDDQSDLFASLYRCSHSIMRSIAYGERYSSSRDPDMKRFRAGVEAWSAIMASPTANLIDAYPWLRHLPSFLFPELGKADRHYRSESAEYMRLLDKFRSEQHAGKHTQCIAAVVAEGVKTGRLTALEASYLTTVPLEAGNDTTSCTLYGFVQAMLLFPHAQQMLSEELTRVIGERIPVAEDWTRLPYLRACVKETLRWMPTVLIGAAPHMVSEDCTALNYKIPKGAWIVMNVHRIHYDAANYREPDVFDPSRFLGGPTTSSVWDGPPEAAQRDHFVFGAGQRMCAGIAVAEQMLFTAMGALVWAFKITPVVDKVTGKEILPDPRLYTEGFISRPRDFPVCITPRSAERAQIVRDSWAVEEGKLDERGQWKVPPSIVKAALDENV